MESLVLGLLGSPTLIPVLGPDQIRRQIRIRVPALRSRIREPYNQRNIPTRVPTLNPFP